MRFERLRIPSYGPFTDLTLDFPIGNADFHLLYGPNEAGKSSLLRAVRDLLFGIHGQTPDDFLHGYKKLRIAGVIGNRAGKRLSFQRRKGKKNTLLDEGGKPLPDDTLAEFLGIVDRHFFGTVFGLGSEGLRQGAEALLHGQGELGQALFSTSLAGTPIHRILASLDREARALFDGRARTNVTIRPALHDYEEMLRSSKAALVKPESWETTLLELELAENGLAEIDDKLAVRRMRRDWLQRCLDALPLLGQLDEQEHRLAMLPAMGDLGEGFVDDVEKALTERDGARQTLSQLSRRIEALEERIAANQPAEDLLARSADIESAHQRLAVYREWKTELENAKTESDRAGTELRAGMRELGLSGGIGALEEYRVPAAAEQGLREATRVMEQAAADLRAANNELERLRRDRTEVGNKLEKLPLGEASALRSALAETGAAIEVVKNLPRQQAHVDTALSELESLHGRLSNVLPDLRATFALRVPGGATLRQFETESRQIESERSQARADLAEAERNLRQLGRNLERLQRRGALPTLEALAAARHHRDELWSKVLAAWTDGQVAVASDSRPLADLYATAVKAADDVADRLREEAESMSQIEELNARLLELEDLRNQNQRQLAGAEAAQADWEQRWRSAWSGCGLSPASPAEMIEWRDLWLEFRACFESWETARRELARARTDVETATSRLAALLPEAAEQSLQALRDEAQRRVQQADELKGARAQLNAQAAELESQLQGLLAQEPELAQAAERTRLAWAERCRTLGLAADANSDASLALLQMRKDLIDRFDAWTSLQHLIAGKQRSVEHYESDIETLASAAGLAAGTIEVRENALWTALEEMRARRTRQLQARADLKSELERRSRLQQTVREAESRVAACLTRADIRDETALEALLGNLKVRHSIATEIAGLRRALHVPARGEPLQAFIERLRAEPGDSLTAERDELEQKLIRLEDERDRIVQDLARLQREKQALEQSGAQASEYLQAARIAAAGVRRDAARYLRLRFATHFLREQIEQFREQNQAPLLARAGELFSNMTAGSFDGLRAAFGEDDRPMLVGMRSDKEVTIQGMSDGTRDQLYLALRLAAIERHQIHHEPMPLIVDDLLVTFDDQRCRAILPLLRDLATHTQILLFTHHRHLLDLARETLANDCLHVAEL